jgi:hypothetical protein
VTLCLLLASCSGGGGPADTSPPPNDARPDNLPPDRSPDRTAVDAPWPDFNMGEGCVGNSDCKKESPICLVLDPARPVRICTRTCVLDNPKTPGNEDTCPPGFICGAFKVGATYEKYCLKKCAPSLTQNPCPPSSNQTCHPLSAKTTAVIDQAACLNPACRNDRDCPVYADKPCTLDTDCATLGATAFCSDHECALPGKCAPSGLCGPHTQGKATAKVGDPCKNDLDCPGNGGCLQEVASAYGATKPYYRNGYCTVSYCVFSKDLPEHACPQGSACNRLFNGGLCMKTCKLTAAQDCRGNTADKGGDYECYALQKVAIGSTPVAPEPICAAALTVPCDTMNAGCAQVGDTGNPTNMSCRDPITNAAKTDAQDPTGVCLDDTASGPF